LPREDKHNKIYSNQDNDVRGDWSSGTMLATTFNSKYVFPITKPNGEKILPPSGRCWRYSKNKIDELVQDNRIWFGKNGNNVPRIKRYLSEVQQGVVPVSLLKYKLVGSGQDGTNELKKIFDMQVFDFPKPSSLIKHLLNIISNSYSNDIILDFFAGSGTTAHAVLDLNKEDNGNRNFILVQLPEKTPDKSEAKKAGYDTISDIAKERIRRVITKIKEERKQQKLNDTAIDLGFKVFKLTKSNYSVWENYNGKDQVELKKYLDTFKSPLIPKYNELNVVYECIIKEGYSLNSNVEKMKVENNNVYKITDEEQTFYICLDKEINKKIIDKLNINKETLFICLDMALDDSLKKNLSLQCNLKVI
jgi:adenine-specific DNA-methyltransferase